MKRVNNNTLLMTDVYKVGHESFYPEKLNEVCSYLTTRSSKRFDNVLFFGLQAIIKKNLSSAPTTQDVLDFISMYKSVLGTKFPDRFLQKLVELVDLGYWPLEIKAVKEGSILPHHQCLVTIRNTHKDFAWLPGFLESMILKVWNTCTVATNSKKYHDLVIASSIMSCDDHNHVPFSIHDFGFRGTSSEETAELSGLANIVSFLGSDTIPAIWAAKEYYGVDEDQPIALSVPATEHSTMSVNILMVKGILESGGEFMGYTISHPDVKICFDGDVRLFAEALVFKEIITKKHPTRIVSIVSDTYNYWGVLTKVAPWLKKDIVNRVDEGPAGSKVVFRPDSGSPEKIICGDPDAPHGSNEQKGSLRILEEVFGATKNKKGFKVLNPKVGLIYGDGMYYDRFEKILGTMIVMGHATSNLVIGVGGLLLQQHSRDDLGFAIKATYAEVDGKSIEVYKDPKTDQKKKSHVGLMKLIMENGEFKTIDRVQKGDTEGCLLRTVYLDGEFMNQQTLSDVRREAGTFY